jgi:2-polyprenyl-3-methyl-5-hydroxy-6-metoxy-1,4-benzoquinol methylase
MHPFADTFISQPRLSESEPVYPLSVVLCHDCGHAQTACITDPNERYSLYDYSYTSSNSQFARTHWTKYVEDILNKIELAKDSFIIEIGSNDGFLTEQFLNHAYRVLGVDASKYMADLAEKRGVKTIVGLFGSGLATEIKAQYGRARLIIANNVFNHSEDPADFARGVSMLLDDGGTFVSEQPYWYISIKSGKFDQIYHEHVSYFSAKSISAIITQSNMGVWHMEQVDYHGGSLRTFAKHSTNPEPLDDSSRKMIAEEEVFGLFDSRHYKDFMRQLLHQRSELLSTIYNVQKRGIPIVAVGAAAKGNTFLNFYRLDSSVIDYVTDASPHKQGKYTPLTRIPIVDDNIFRNYAEVNALILSWNLTDSLQRHLLAINPKITFIAIPALKP